jgi:DNA-binding transcriptional MerR regulator
MATYSIKDLERITGIKAHTIRIWEKRYRIVEPKRTDSNIRLYCDTEVKKLLNISLLLRYGYKISRLAKLDPQELSRKIMEVSMLPNGLDSQVENLVIAMIEMDEARFEKTLNMSIIKEGFENTLFRIIYPFFERVGVLWQAGSISPAQEHFISNLVKQKIYVAIDSIPFIPATDQKSFLVFLPEWELHELGMLVYVFLLKSRGFKVIYLGQSVPEDDVISVCTSLKPEYILSGFSSPVNHDQMITYLKTLSGAFNGSMIFATGYQTSAIHTKLPANVRIIESALQFKEEIISAL